MSEREGETRLYLYGITTVRELPATGLATGSSAIFSLASGELAAIVSRASPGKAAFDQDLAVSHVRILASLPQEMTILPAKGGTILTKTALAELMRKNAAGFAGILAELNGKIELGLQAAWRHEELRRIMLALAEEREVREAKQDLSKGLSSILAIGELIQHKMAERIESLRKILLAPLLKLAVDHKANNLMTERMVLNEAFLVRRDHTEAFDEAVGRLVENHADLEFKYSGPWPAFNFVPGSARMDHDADL